MALPPARRAVTPALKRLRVAVAPGSVRLEFVEDGVFIHLEDPDAVLLLIQNLQGAHASAWPTAVPPEDEVN